MRKKIAVLLIITALIVSGIMVVFSGVEEKTITVTVDGEKITFDANPEIIAGRTMVPIRAIFEAFDMDVTWNEKLRKVTAVNDDLEIELTIDSDTALINKKEIKLDVKSYIRSGRTMIPLRFLAEATGAIVTWDSETRSVLINKSNKEESSSDDLITKESVELTYKIVDTGLTDLFTDYSKVNSIDESSSFYGQDGNYDGNQPSYLDNKDGTVTDLVTGLMWQQTMESKMSLNDALEYANNSSLAGYSDWRIPSIKELFSLIIFTGKSGGEVATKLYIDEEYFDQPIGDTSIGEREIDAQTWSSTRYVSTTMVNNDTIFGVNFIDGRIKGYNLFRPRSNVDNTNYFRLVRGDTSYGENVFVDNNDGTISDLATGLMWQMKDDAQVRDWEESLVYSESLELAGHSDWRLPNVKELQSIVDYTKSVETTDSPAINDLFLLSEIVDPNGEKNYGYYWSSTTHQDGRNTSDSASYVSFGEAQGEMFGEVLDVHGAGSVRSDPKSGDIEDYPTYFGPQGDVRYVYNYVLAVRTITEDTEIIEEKEESEVLNEIYNLFTPLKSRKTYLMDMNKEIVHTWESNYTPGNSVYLKEDGSILRTGRLSNNDNKMYSIGGSGGIVELIDWNGNVTWSFEYADDNVLLHHDIEELPNGNILMIAWETMSKEDAIRKGRDESLIKDGKLYLDHIIEVKPLGFDGGEIVWEWHLSDHLIQDYDESKDNYGDIDKNIELVDFNYVNSKSLNAGGADWTHINSIDYNEELDQILLSVHGFSEIWIIDHSTTTKEAASHEGGNQNKGGDILFRWGNPSAYDEGYSFDQVFFGQHDAKWLDSEEDYSILVFNNGIGKDKRSSSYSTVDEISIPYSNGSYESNTRNQYLPDDITWTYKADTPTEFYSENISGAQRLASGNTLICSGANGKVFEVNAKGDIVWEFTNIYPSVNSNGSPLFRFERYHLNLNDFE